MADTVTLRLTLRPALVEALQQAVATGEYASQDEVVGEALLEWRMRRALDQTERDALGRLWDEGVASGPSRFNSIDDIRQEARRRFMSENDQA